MPRIVGITISDDKRVDVGLTAVYGLGRQNIMKLLRKAAVDPSTKAADLSAEELTRLTKTLEEFVVEGSLRKVVAENIKRLKVIGSYRGLRHHQGLPSRGQRTRSNARTKRGKRKTIGAMRKEDMAKFEAAKKTKSGGEK